MDALTDMGSGRCYTPTLPSRNEDVTGQGFAAWLAISRANAMARGGKPWSKSQLATAGEEYRRSRRKGDDLHVAGRKPGEIANPITGEIVTGCLTIGLLAELLSMTTDKLTDMLVGIGAVQRVLDYREVPMVCQPAVRKPRYFLTPEVTRSGIEEGLVVPVETYRDDTLRAIILITPSGQKKLRHAVGCKSGTAQSKPGERRRAIERLMLAGHPQAEIMRLTGLPRQTVSRHVLSLRGRG